MEEKHKEVQFAGFRDGGRPREAGKGKEMSSSLGPLERNSALANTLISALCQISDLQNC